MKTPLHVLAVEDSEDDARLMLRELDRAGYNVTSVRVETEQELREQLAKGQWQIVISDYALPRFDGLRALKIVTDSALDLPFIFVSGTMGEDIAVEAMRAGAHDYVMKGNLTRLVPAIERELRDAIERRHHRAAETQMRMSEHKYRHLFRSMSDAAVLVAEETDKIIDVNEQAEILLGRAREEILGLSSESLSPVAQNIRGPDIRSDDEDAHPDGFETVVFRKDGTPVPVHVTTSRVQLYERPFLLKLFRDITERKRAETALRNVLRQARTFIMHHSVSAPEDWRPDLPGWKPSDFRWRTRFADEESAREVLPLETSPGRSFKAAWTAAKFAEDAAAMEIVATRAFATRSSTWQQEFRCIDRDKRVRWISQRAIIETVGHNQWHVSTINTDITERVVAEDALRTSEERLSTIFHFSPTAICIVRASDNRFIDANEAFIRGCGYEREDIIGHTPYELNLWEQPEDREAIMKALQEKGAAVSFKLRGRRKTGEIGIGLASVTRIALNGEEHFLWLIQDITNLDQAEKARQESDQRFRQLAEAIDEVFWLTDVAKTEMIYVSPTYRSVWGRTCESLYAAPRSWLDSIHPEDRDRVIGSIGKQAKGEYDLEYRILRPDGGLRWIHERAFPVEDENGKPYRIAGVASDITNRRELEEQFRQSQKMDAVGQLAGGIAHDFNNLLTVVQMQSSLLIDDLKQSPEALAGVQQIMDAAKRAANLTRQLLTFSRRQTQVPRALDLAAVVGNMTKMLRRVLGEDIRLESQYAPASPQVFADPGMMEQVLMNLVINARDAMPDGGRLSIAVDTVNINADHVEANPAARIGQFACLTVSDTGSGIAPEIRHRIFEPFFTTKEVGKGTGLGLATVFGIVQQHNGWIEVSSEVGRGTTFRVFLPKLETEKTSEGAINGGDVVRGGHETILLVEDEPVVRSIAAKALRQYGYQVIEAENATSAMARWESTKGRIDLLVSDVVMPGGISGKELAEHLLRKKPELRVIYTTGHSAGKIGQQLQLEAGKNYLPKPYSFGELAMIIRQRLDERLPVVEQQLR